EWAHRLEITVPQVAEQRSVHVIRSGTRDDVHHAAGRSAVLRRITVGDDLKLLHTFLRNRRPDAVGGVVDRIFTVDVDQVGAGALPAHVQARSGRSADAGGVITRQPRIRQCKVNVVAAVNWQI